MKLNTILKILLVIGSIFLSFYFTSINYGVDQLINARYTELSKIKYDPTLDTATNRIMRVQRRRKINQEINKLREKRHSSLFGYLAILISIFTGWLVKKFWPDLWKRKSVK